MQAMHAQPTGRASRQAHMFQPPSIVLYTCCEELLEGACDTGVARFKLSAEESIVSLAGVAEKLRQNVAIIHSRSEQY